MPSLHDLQHKRPWKQRRWQWKRWRHGRRRRWRRRRRLRLQQWPHGTRATQQSHKLQRWVLVFFCLIFDDSECPKDENSLKPFSIIILSDRPYPDAPWTSSNNNNSNNNNDAPWRNNNRGNNSSFGGGNSNNNSSFNDNFDSGNNLFNTDSNFSSGEFIENI